VYSISAFGLPKAADETADDLIMRICEESPCSGRNVWPVAEGTLMGAGFRAELSEPPPNHYDVILGSELEIANVEELVKCLEPGRMRNPAWKRSRS
jgi:hypothetical protein